MSRIETAKRKSIRAKMEGTVGFEPESLASAWIAFSPERRNSKASALSFPLQNLLHSISISYVRG